MKTLFLLIAIAVACFANLAAINLTSLEYTVFSGDEVYISNSIPISADSLITATAQLDLSALPVGFYRLRLRTWDQNNRPSLWTNQLLFKTSPNLDNLSSLHYCFDGEYANAQSLPLSPFAPDGTWILEDELAFPVGTEPGLHVLQLWTSDASTKISHRIEKLVSYIPSVSEPQHIVSLGWYFSGLDANPDNIYYHNVSNPLTDITEELIVSLPALVAGENYRLNLFAVQEDGTPSLTLSYDFTYQFTVENVTLSIDGNNLILSWDEIPGAIRYWVEKKSSPDADGTWIEAISPPLSMQATENKEFYRVKAEK